MELLAYARWRKRVLEWIPAKAHILEVGVGTGKNLPNYLKHHEVFAIDISARMLERAKGLAAKQSPAIHLAQMDVESLAFRSKVFDAVIATYVFCSVDNPLKGLRELKRVVKSGGTVVFLEHMRSENEFLGEAMDLVNPVVAQAFGPNINRRTVENIRQAGFKVFAEEYLLSSVFRIIVAKPQATQCKSQRGNRRSS